MHALIVVLVHTLRRQAPQHALTALLALFATLRGNLSTIFADRAIIPSTVKVKIVPCALLVRFKHKEGLHSAIIAP